MSDYQTSLLLSKKIIKLNTNLAVQIGLNEALVLQQLFYWLDKGTEIDGRYWVYKTYAKWREKDFPFWSESTIKRAFKNLQDLNLVEVQQLSDNSFDRKNYYTINFKGLKELEALTPVDSDEVKMNSSKSHSADNDEVKMNSSDDTKMNSSDEVKMDSSLREYKETKNKIKSKKTHSIPDDFKPTDKQIEKMKTYGINADLLLDSFINGSKANGKKYKCWNSAFSTWINNEIKWSNLKPVEQQPTNSSYKEFEPEEETMTLEEQRQAYLAVFGGKNESA